MPHEHHGAGVEARDLSRRVRARAVGDVDGDVLEDVRLQGELRRGLAHVVAQRGGVADVEHEKLLVAVGDVAQPPVRPVDARSGVPRRGEVQRRPGARDQRGAAGHPLHAPIDERPLPSPAGAAEDDDGVARRRHGPARDGDHEIRLLVALDDGVAGPVEGPVATRVGVRRLALLVLGHGDGGRIHAERIEEIGALERLRGRRR